MSGKRLSFGLVVGAFLLVVTATAARGVDWLSIACLVVAAGCLGFILGIETR